MMDFETWKQRRDEMVREAQRNHLARALRGSRTERGSRLAALLAWELGRGAGYVRKLFRSSDGAERKRRGS